METAWATGSNHVRALEVIYGVSVDLTPAQAHSVRTQAAVRLSAERSASSSLSKMASVATTLTDGTAIKTKTKGFRSGTSVRRAQRFRAGSGAAGKSDPARWL